MRVRSKRLLIAGIGLVLVAALFVVPRLIRVATYLSDLADMTPLQHSRLSVLPEEQSYSEMPAPTYSIESGMIADPQLADASTKREGDALAIWNKSSGIVVIGPSPPSEAWGFELYTLVAANLGKEYESVGAAANEQLRTHWHDWQWRVAKTQPLSASAVFRESTADYREFRFRLRLKQSKAETHRIVLAETPHIWAVMLLPRTPEPEVGFKAYADLCNKANEMVTRIIVRTATSDETNRLMEQIVSSFVPPPRE